MRVRIPLETTNFSLFSAVFSACFHISEDGSEIKRAYLPASAHKETKTYSYNHNEVQNHLRQGLRHIQLVYYVTCECPFE